MLYLTSPLRPFVPSREWSVQPVGCVLTRAQDPVHLTGGAARVCTDYVAPSRVAQHHDHEGCRKVGVRGEQDYVLLAAALDGG